MHDLLHDMRLFPFLHRKNHTFSLYSHHYFIFGFFKVIHINGQLLSLAANRAASLTIFAKSAPTIPGVPFANDFKSTLRLFKTTFLYGPLKFLIYLCNPEHLRLFVYQNGQVSKVLHLEHQAYL